MTVALRARIGASGRTAPPIAGFVTSATNRAATAANTVPAVTGCKVGDLLIAFAAGNDQTTTLTTPTDPVWTLLADTGSAGFGRMRAYTATATADNQAGGTWTWPSTHNHIVTILAYRSVGTPTVSGVAHAATVATLDAPTITASATSLLIAAAFFTTNGNSPAWSGTMTTRVTAAATTFSQLISEQSVSSGATGTRTFTISGTASAVTVIDLLIP